MQLHNRLADETSPYLHLHKENPVHWQPWNRQTLDLARDLDRPILLSIGYAACHWCHVMARESFEDEEVAHLMNEFYVNIKVDREERPDIDRIYMAALAATGEQGGWPLTMFLTPEARPIWGGTYFPKHGRYGRPGFLDVLRSVHKAWQQSRDELDSGASALGEHIARHLAAARNEDVTPDRQTVPQLAARILTLIDPVDGGIRGAPKFPNAPFMQLLWLAAQETGNGQMARTVIDSHDKMLAGGIYDHVGGGLCRYATDAGWLLPHFEKMLYDNALLIQILTQISTDMARAEPLRIRIEEVAQWLRREMQLDSGAFASSLDAESEGEEGRFYCWDRNEIESILQAGAERFLQHYRLVHPQGWPGKPLLMRETPGVPGPQDQADLAELLRHRALRIRPRRDDKVLTDWNGLAIRALADAARRFEEPGWHLLARQAFDAICASVRNDDRLPHAALRHSRLFPALSSDYAAMINAAISLYQLEQDAELLDRARRWAEILRQDHGDGAHGHFLTAAEADDVPIRLRGDTDDAMPSPTAQIVEALVRLAAITSDIALQEEAYACAAAALARTQGQIDGYVGIYSAVHLALTPRKLVMVETSDKPEFSRIAAASPDLRRVDLRIPVGDRPTESPVPGTAQFDTSRPGAWLCEGHSCLPPIRDADALRRQLQPKFSPDQAG